MGLDQNSSKFIKIHQNSPSSMRPFSKFREVNGKTKNSPKFIKIHQNSGR
jgi:hypothetical protein